MLFDSLLRLTNKRDSLTHNEKLWLIDTVNNKLNIEGQEKLYSLLVIYNKQRKAANTLGSGGPIKPRVASVKAEPISKLRFAKSFNLPPPLIDGASDDASASSECQERSANLRPQVGCARSERSANLRPQVGCAQREGYDPMDPFYDIEKVHPRLQTIWFEFARMHLRIQQNNSLCLSAGDHVPLLDLRQSEALPV